MAFDFEDVGSLLEFLAGAGGTPSFKLKMSCGGGGGGAAAASFPGVVQSISVRTVVQGVEAVADIFAQDVYCVRKISWKGVGGTTVEIDCDQREVYVAADSMSFVELCRHHVTGKAVRNFSADLRIA
jgi:hypothetical protein